MDKAWDVKDLEARLLAQGLPAVEGLAKIAAIQVLAWVKDSAVVAAKDAPLLALVPVVVDALSPALMAEIDKIDGKVG